MLASHLKKTTFPAREAKESNFCHFLSCWSDQDFYFIFPTLLSIKRDYIRLYRTTATNLSTKENKKTYLDDHRSLPKIKESVRWSWRKRVVFLILRVPLLELTYRVDLSLLKIAILQLGNSKKDATVGSNFLFLFRFPCFDVKRLRKKKNKSLETQESLHLSCSQCQTSMPFSS